MKMRRLTLDQRGIWPWGSTYAFSWGVWGSCSILLASLDTNRVGSEFPKSNFCGPDPIWLTPSPGGPDGIWLVEIPGGDGLAFSNWLRRLLPTPKLGPLPKPEIEPVCPPLFEEWFEWGREFVSVRSGPFRSNPTPFDWTDPKGLKRSGPTEDGPKLNGSKPLPEPAGLCSDESKNE